MWMIAEHTIWDTFPTSSVQKGSLDGFLLRAVLAFTFRMHEEKYDLTRGTGMHAAHMNGRDLLRRGWAIKLPLADYSDRSSGKQMMVSSSTMRLVRTKSHMVRDCLTWCCLCTADALMRIRGVLLIDLPVGQNGTPLESSKLLLGDFVTYPASTQSSILFFNCTISTM